MKIGILSAGGDCPGINAAIRGVGKAALLTYGMEVWGVSSGFLGLIQNDVEMLDESRLSGILTLGGTILGTSREKPFKKRENGDQVADKVKLIKENYSALGFDCIVCIGGNGTMKTAYQLIAEGINVIGIPKTIDNDVWGTEYTFGFDSALSIATEALDRLHTTANSHRRIIVMEVMGHHAGWLALHAGIAGGADVILIPEIPYREEVVAECLQDRIRKGKPYSIVVVAEGIQKGNGNGAADYITRMITQKTDLEARQSILGYIQRGGTPSPMDRILATRFGTHAAELIAAHKFGQMVALHGNSIVSTPLAETAGKLKTVPAMHPLIRAAELIGTRFGDKP